MINKICPILATANTDFDKDWWEKYSSCKRSGCAWWDRHGERCYIVTGQLAIASAVRSGLASQFQRYGMSISNPYSREQTDKKELGVREQGLGQNEEDNTPQSPLAGMENTPHSPLAGMENTPQSPLTKRGSDPADSPSIKRGQGGVLAKTQNPEPNTSKSEVNHE